MANWGGFTEEDLRQLAYPGKIDMSKTPGGSPKKQANFGKQKNKNANRDRTFNQQKKRVTLSDVVEVMPVDQMLNPAESLSNGDAVPVTTNENHETKSTPLKPKNTKSPPKSALKPSKPLERHVSQSNSVANDEKSSDEVSLTNADCSKELNEEEGLNRELSQIKKFQHQQKLIEEKNQQTKTLLTQAIKERRAKAETEANLLTDLQKELSRLDNILTTDVSIIRDRIEAASLEYTESQKRYQKAEKEFVEAKMELFRRAETKEKLTEHLYTIIYQNEMRKAQKLSELMEMLQLSSSVEEVECILPAIPPIPIYNPVQTLYSHNKSTPHKNSVMANSDSDPSKPETCDKKADDSVESKVSLPADSVSSSSITVSIDPEDNGGKEKDTANTPERAIDVPTAVMDSSLPSQMADTQSAFKSSEESRSPESEGNKDCGDNERVLPSDGGEIPGNSNLADSGNVPTSSSQTDAPNERTRKEKTTLRELAQ